MIITSRLIGHFGDFVQGRKAAQQLLRRRPTFIPAHNNLSLMDFTEGKLRQAIERARYVLTLEPDNYQALGNLVRYLTLTGQEEEGRRCLQTLLTIDKEDMELVWKQAEALAIWDDDGAEMRNSTIPLDAGSLAPNANSPKSLSKVIRTRPSVCARCRTS